MNCIISTRETAWMIVSTIDSVNSSLVFVMAGTLVLANVTHTEMARIFKDFCVVQ